MLSALLGTLLLRHAAQRLLLILLSLRLFVDALVIAIGWLQVGRSYNAAPVAQEQNSAASRHDAIEVGTKIQASRGTSRRKAADFFDATVGGTSPTAGESYKKDDFPEQSIAHLSSGKGNGGRAGSKNDKEKKRKRASRHSLPSDEDSDSSGHSRKPRRGEKNVMRRPSIRPL